MAMRASSLILGIIAVVLLYGCASSDTSSSQPTQPAQPAATPSIALSTDSVVATLVSGASNLTQDIDITAGSSAALASLVISDAATGAAPSIPWLSATLSSQTAPARLTVTLAPSALAAGTYSATLRLVAANAAPKTVRVSLVVRARPQLVLDLATIAVTSDFGTLIPAQTIKVTSLNGPVDGLKLSAPDCGAGVAPWITPTLAASAAPTTVSIAIVPTGLAVGAYSCTIVISTAQAPVDSASQTIRVSLSLRSVPRIALSVDTVHFAAATGGGSLATVTVTNTGSGSLTGLSAGTISYAAGSTGWLNASLQSSSAPTSLALTASATTLAAGTYIATVPVSSSAANVANSPQTLVVSFVVTDPPPLPNSLVMLPSTYTFTTKQGSGAGVTFTFTATHTTGTPYHKMTLDPFSYPAALNNWLFINYTCDLEPVTNFWQTPCYGYISVRPPTTLLVGTYSGALTFKSLATGESVKVTTTLIITP